jgi:sec-independent protein translocase protein TatA
MNSLRPWHLLVLAVVFLILFGSKRLPDSARSLGRSLRIFKSEIQELNKDENPGNKKSDPNTDK